MITALAQVLATLAGLALMTFLGYAYGVSTEQKTTRRYAQRAYGNQRIAQILAEANAELKHELLNLEAGRDITSKAAREFERMIREAGL